MFVGYGRFFAGETDLAIAHFEKGLSDSWISSLPRFKTMILFGMTGIYWNSLILNELRQSAQQYLVYGKKFHLSEATNVAHCFLGWLHYSQNELEAAEKHFSTAVDIPVIVNLSFHAQAICGLALTFQALGKIELAKKTLNEFQARLSEGSNFFILRTIKACQTELLLGDGQVAEAIHWAESYKHEPRIGLHLFFLPQLALIKVWLAQDTPSSLDHARNLLDQLDEFTQKVNLKSAQLPILTLQALLENHLGNRAAALEMLNKRFTLRNPMALFVLLWMLAPRWLFC